MSVNDETYELPRYSPEWNAKTPLSPLPSSPLLSLTAAARQAMGDNYGRLPMPRRTGFAVNLTVYRDGGPTVSVEWLEAPADDLIIRVIRQALDGMRDASAP